MDKITKRLNWNITSIFTKGSSNKARAYEVTKRKSNGTEIEVLVSV